MAHRYDVDMIERAADLREARAIGYRVMGAILGFVVVAPILAPALCFLAGAVGLGFAAGGALAAGWGWP